VVENMSWWEQPDGSRVELFGSGGGAALAASLSQLTGTTVPLLGQVPLDQRLREGGDEGVPIVVSAPESPAAAALDQVADQLARRQRGLAGVQLGLSPTRR
jgi:ATP-binding protein involved in chromosome partitioning